ncbi:uncharacterized protein TNCT_20451 [Trichonephila clavata]|uniref:Uncharacterized protein n=1 Tax=Trichonephila clavata TaxID=2740835 RepID=A0A8X6LZT1_TRICU|nr:uncharacterized protein TNCT_20451 [Trichonephila clavata]
MTDQGDHEQQQFAVEMDEFDNRPFAERAAHPLVQGQSARVRRIMPQSNVHGCQVQRPVVTRNPSRSEQSRRRSRIEADEPINVTGPPTLRPRQWYPRDEFAGIEDAQSSMNGKVCVTGGIVLFLIIIVLMIINTYLMLSYEIPENSPTLVPSNPHAFFP